MQVYRPNEKCPWGRGDVSLFALGVNAIGDGGYVQAKEEDIEDHVQNLGKSVIVKGITEIWEIITLSTIPSLQESAMMGSADKS
jgi:hypothetical protein